MKIKLSLVIAALIVCGAGCMAKGKGSDSKPKAKPICAEWLMPDSTVYQRLGRNLASVLFAPQSVKCYAIEYQDSVAPVQLEPYFAQGKLIAKLNREQTAILQYALLGDSLNYKRNDIAVTAPYVPALDFEFSRKGQVAHVVISLNDFTWSVLYDDKKQFNFNFNSPTFFKFAEFFYKKANHE